MRLLINMDGFAGGPAVFRKRLYEHLSFRDDVKLVKSAREKFDIELSFIRNRIKHKKPKVLRLDGCYYKPSQGGMNRNIINSINQSKYVIYQSQFSKEMCETILKTSKKNVVIHNGIDLSSLDSVPADPSIPAGSFCASANWRPNKRPVSMIEGFLESSCGRTLYILGDHKNIPKQYKRIPNIRLLGHKKHAESIAIMKACDYMIHLCHIDSCPNAVVEALACGCRILCTNLGGTREIVKEDGVVMDVDKWNFSLKEFKHVDNLSKQDVAEGIHSILKMVDKADRTDLDIKPIADMYLKTLEHCL